MTVATPNTSTGKSIGNLGLRRAQFKVLASRARFRVVVAGRRFGKTRLALVMLIVVALRYPHTRNWYVAPTRPWAKDVAWGQLDVPQTRRRLGRQEKTRRDRPPHVRPALPRRGCADAFHRRIARHGGLARARQVRRARPAVRRHLERTQLRQIELESDRKSTR